jgi:hypothetical protein
MSLYVQIVNGQVAQCIDSTPPSPVGTDGWRNAVEIRPEIIPNRQGWTDHTWDLTTDPVKLIYGTFDIAVADRQNQLKAQAGFTFQQAVNAQTQAVINGGTYDSAAVQTAHDKMVADIAAITAATTHDELDLITL